MLRSHLHVRCECMYLSTCIQDSVLMYEIIFLLVRIVKRVSETGRFLASRKTAKSIVPNTAINFFYKNY